MSRTYRRRQTRDAREAQWTPRAASLDLARRSTRGHRQCDGKESYPSKRVARGIVRVMQATGQTRPGYRLDAYKCACGSWHLGNTRLKFLRDRGRR